MPPAQALVGLPTCGVDTAEQYEQRPAEVQAQAVMADPLLQAQVAQPCLPEGVYVGEGVVPIPRKLAEKIWRWEFMDMGELLPECWGITGEGRSGPLHRRTRVAADIFSWIQCFTSYVSVQRSQHPEAIPELMAYMAMIVRSSQDFKDLAWLRYDVGFRRQAALTKNRKWSQINYPVLHVLHYQLSGWGVSMRAMSWINALDG